MYYHWKKPGRRLAPRIGVNELADALQPVASASSQLTHLNLARDSCIISTEFLSNLKQLKELYSCKVDALEPGEVANLAGLSGLDVLMVQ